MATSALKIAESETAQRGDGVRVVFGAGIRATVGDELARLNCSRALILSTPQQSDEAMALAEVAGARAAGIFTRATMHTPVSISEEALAHARAIDADSLVAIGGGSTTGLSKAIALRSDLPQIIVPTTYAGSEATPILGQTENGVKTTLTDPRVLPEVILYDPELVVSLPVGMTVTSGLNAMAHAAEALYAQNRTAEVEDMALEGLRVFIGSLPRVVAEPGDLAARQETLRGAFLCGSVLGRAGMALHHKLCHTLGGSFDLPHAETHAVILPHAIAFNERGAGKELAPLAALLDAGNAGCGLHAFAARLGAPLALRDLGLAETDLDRAADLAVEKPYWNPQPVTRDDIRTLLQAAWAGDEPAFAV